MDTTRELLTTIANRPRHCATCARARTAAIDALLDALLAERATAPAT